MYAIRSYYAPGRASLYTGMYLHNHRVAINGTPLDRRHSNVALEARKAGYDPALFGYTDVSADPRAHHPGDPCLQSYEGILPGMTVITSYSIHYTKLYDWAREGGEAIATGRRLPGQQPAWFLLDRGRLPAAGE